MKKLMSILLIISFFLLLTVSCSSGGKNSKFNQHISNIDKSISAINKLQSNLKKYLNDLSNKDLKKAEKSVDKAIELTNESVDNLKKAIEEAEKAMALNVSKESTKYASMILESLNSRLKSYKLMIKGLKEFKKAVRMADVSTQSELDAFTAQSNKSLSTLSKASQIESDAQKQYADAQLYFSSIK